jgi:hypothetical protein
MFEILESPKMEAGQYRDNLAITHRTGAITVLPAVVYQKVSFLSLEGIFLAEIVRNAENFRNFVQGK